MPKHHPFSPSRLQRRALCPASYRIEKDLEDVGSEASRKGSHLHELIAKAISMIPHDHWHDERKIELFIDKNRMYETKEERSVILNVMKYIPKKLKSELFVHTEEELEYKDEYGKILYFGTADMVAKDEFGQLLVFDWKTGNGAVPLARFNMQLKAYALAAMQTYGSESCNCLIYNPVTKKQSSGQFKNKEKLRAEILSVINRCKAENAPVIPGENQCRFCLGKAHNVCPEWPELFPEQNKSSVDNVENQLNTSEIKYEIQKQPKSVEKPIRVYYKRYYDKPPKKEVSDAEGCMFGFMWGCMPIIIFIFLVWLLKALS